MRGDRVTITYQTPSGTEKTVVQARRDGGYVRTQRNREAVVVTEENQAGKEVVRAEFAPSAVISMVVDWEAVPRTKPKRS